MNVKKLLNGKFEMSEDDQYQCLLLFEVNNIFELAQVKSYVYFFVKQIDSQILIQENAVSVQPALLFTKQKLVR